MSSPQTTSTIRLAQPWNLATANLSEIRQIDFQAAILPLGATEPHNLHLPYSTDTLQVDWIVNHLCSQAWSSGARILALPALPYGTESNLENFPWAMNLRPSTVFAVLTDLLETVSKNGIQKLLILNGHGGNDLKPWLREIYGQTKVQVFLCNWLSVLTDMRPEVFDHAEDHAGELETSCILAIDPALVARNADGSLAADDGAISNFRFDALQAGWVKITRPWHLLTKNSGSGNPHAASAAKGQLALDKLAERLVPFLVQLANEPLDDTFPFECPVH